MLWWENGEIAIKYALFLLGPRSMQDWIRMGCCSGFSVKDIQKFKCEMRERERNAWVGDDYGLANYDRSEENDKRIKSKIAQFHLYLGRICRKRKFFFHIPTSFIYSEA